ncbi:MAG: hypothetical protein J7K22_04150 [Nanoarchaeota archaeon]|nr:hypothetical protein [Nanoarchaeota archaeon]
MENNPEAALNLHKIATDLKINLGNDYIVKGLEEYILNNIDDNPYHALSVYEMAIDTKINLGTEFISVDNLKASILKQIKKDPKLGLSAHKLANKFGFNLDNNYIPIDDLRDYVTNKIKEERIKQAKDVYKLAKEIGIDLSDCLSNQPTEIRRYFGLNSFNPKDFYPEIYALLP